MTYYRRLKQIIMRACRDQNDFGIRCAVDQQPVGFDMAFAVVLPVAFQRMVFELAGKRFAVCKFLQYQFKRFDVGVLF